MQTSPTQTEHQHNDCYSSYGMFFLNDILYICSMLYVLVVCVVRDALCICCMHCLICFMYLSSWELLDMCFSICSTFYHKGCLICSLYLLLLSIHVAWYALCSTYILVVCVARYAPSVFNHKCCLICSVHLLLYVSFDMLCVLVIINVAQCPLMYLLYSLLDMLYMCAPQHNYVLLDIFCMHCSICSMCCYHTYMSLNMLYVLVMGMCGLIRSMCLLLYELLNISLVLYIVRIARYALRIAKCTYYFTCANLNASCNKVFVSIWALYFFKALKMFHLLFNVLVYALCAMYSFMLYVLKRLWIWRIGRSGAAWPGEQLVWLVA